MIKFLKFILPLLFICSITFKCGNKTKAHSDKIDGVSLVSTKNKVSKENILAIKQVNANWIALIPYAFSRTGEPKVYYNSEGQWWGETPKGLKHTAKLAKAQDFKLMLKPQVWIGGEAWTGNFQLESESDWKIWEADYHNYIMKMAKLAESEDIALFCIGTELKVAATERPKFWKKLIADVRKVYSGKLTYGANWDNYHNINFWKLLDYIGVDAYFPLSQKTTPSVDELKHAWKKPVMNLKKLHLKTKTPILFTEYGYRNIDKAAGNQWELLSSRHYDGKLNNEVQLRAYQAFYKTFWNKKWVAGGFFWKWYPKHKTMKSRKNSGYSPQHKPVEKTISKYYKSSEE